MRIAVRLTFVLGLCALLAPSGAAAAQSPLARGILKDAAGTPTSGDVTLLAWPLGLMLHKKRKLPVVTRATAGSDGKFTLAGADMARLRALGAHHGGRVDFMVQGQTPGHIGVSYFTLNVNTARFSTRGTGSAPIKTISLETTKPMRQATTRGHTYSPRQCATYDAALDAHDAFATVGELNNAYRDTVARFSYSRGAATEFGVGVVHSDGAFEIDGSVTVSKSSGAMIGAHKHGPYGRRILTRFRFRKHIQSITCAYGGGYSQTSIRAERWLGGIKRPKQRGTIFACAKRYAPQGADTDFETENAHAIVWKAGVKVFGFSLQTQSGFNESVKTTFNFGHNPTHKICGSNNYGADVVHAPRILSGNKRS